MQCAILLIANVGIRLYGAAHEGKLVVGGVGGRRVDGLFAREGRALHPFLPWRAEHFAVGDVPLL